MHIIAKYNTHACSCYTKIDVQSVWEEHETRKKATSNRRTQMSMPMIGWNGVMEEYQLRSAISSDMYA